MLYTMDMWLSLMTSTKVLEDLVASGQLKGVVCSSKVRCAAPRCGVQLKGAVCQVHQHMFWHSLTLHSQLMGYVMGQDLTWSSSDEHLTPPFQHHYSKRKRAWTIYTINRKSQVCQKAKPTSHRTGQGSTGQDQTLIILHNWHFHWWKTK